MIMDMQSSPELHPAPESQRPRSVIILGWLQILQSLGLLGWGVYDLLVPDLALQEAGHAPSFTPLALFEWMSSGYISIVLAVFLLSLAISLLRLRPWAWLASMIFQGFGLLAALIEYSRQQPNYLGMFLGVILVLYLNQYEVQAAFREKRSFK